MPTTDAKTVGMEAGLAVAQTSPAPGDVMANVAEHVALARAAATEGAALALFPELSLTGYELDHAPSLAFVEHDTRLDSLRETAEAADITLVVGAPVRLDDRLHIGAFILRPDGGAAIYTKQRLGAFPATTAREGVLPPAEATVFHPGDRDPLVHLLARTVAMAICADIATPAHPRAAARRGADTYLASMFVIPSDYDADSARLRAYATEHSLTVALANYGAPTGGLAAAGRSAVWSSAGELLVQLPRAGSAVGVVDPSLGRSSARVVTIGSPGTPV